MRVTLTFWGLIFIYSQINCYNIFPKALVVHSQPSDNNIDSKSKSTYFGFSLLLREKSIMVGAPKANSTHNKNEQGLLYNCSINDNNTCDILNLENEQNSAITLNNTKYYKNKQWLGASIAGGNFENNPLMVCAPRLTATDYMFMTGMCYFMKNETDIPKKIIKNIYDNETNTTHFSTMYELGVSSYWIDQTQEFLLGIPSYNNNQGGFMRYNSISGKFDLKKLNKPKGTKTESSLMGFAVAAGIFDNSGNISYIVSAPRSNHLNGAVFVLDNNPISNGNYRYQLLGSQSFEYFGYSVITEDSNGDGFSDIIVSSPFYTENNYFEVGAIYVYYGNTLKALTELKAPTVICPSKIPRSRFGLTLALLGDINLDNYNDIAVGAPNEENGRVYIFGGSKQGLITKPIQVLEAPSFPNLLQPKAFGYSISSGVDIDGNGVNDIAISAINIDKVFLFKAYPILNVTIFFKVFPKFIFFNVTSFKCVFCISYESFKSTFQEDLNFTLYLKADTNNNRLKFDNNLEQINHTVTVKHNETECREQTIFVNMTTNDNKKTFLIEFGYEHIKKNLTENFLEKCAIIKSENKRIILKQFFIKHLCGNKTKCISDLKISISKSPRNTIILDKLKELDVYFTITNYKDPAYKPQVNINTNQNLPIIQHPPECSVKTFDLQCGLSSEDIVLKNNETKNIKIKFDISNLKGSELRINADVFSFSEELNTEDKSDHVTYEIIACGIIEITEISPPGSQFQMLYENKHKIFEFNKTFEIKNVGSSTLSNLVFNISYPTLLTLNSSKIESPLQPQKEKFFTDGSHQNQIEIYNSHSLSTNISNNFVFVGERKTIAESCNTTNQLIENIYSETIKNITSEAKISFNINEIEKNKIRKEENELKITTFFIKQLSVDSKDTLRIFINFKIDQTYLWDLLKKFQKEFFVYEIKFSVNSLDCSNISMDCTQSYFGFRTSVFETLFKLVPNQKIDIWIYICSFILGTVVYFLIAFVMYKLGFFKRKKHEEVKDFKRQSLMRRSMRITAIPTEFDEIIEQQKKSDQSDEAAVADDNL